VQIPKTQKYIQAVSLFALLEYAPLKAACKMLMKLTSAAPMFAHSLILTIRRNAAGAPQICWDLHNGQTVN